MLLGLHSNLFPTNVKATAKDGGVRIETGSEIETTASMAFYFGLTLSDSLRSPTKSAGRADHRLSQACSVESERPVKRAFLCQLNFSELPFTHLENIVCSCWEHLFGISDFLTIDFNGTLFDHANGI